MKKILLFVALIVLGSSSYVISQPQESWQPIITCNIPYESIGEMNFIDANFGVISGSYIQIKTTSNAGSNWQPANLNGTYISELVFAPNSDTGYCFFGYMHPVLYRTTDKGATWNDCSHDANLGQINAMQFTDGKTGYVGNYSNLYKTTNAGVNWNKIGYFPITSAAQVIDVFFVNKQKGFLIAHPTGSTQAVVHVTYDEGNSWDTLYEAGNLNARQIYFSSENIGYILYEDKLLRTSNGGQDWQLSYQGTATLLTININNEGIGYVGGNKNKGTTSQIFMLKTVDNGAHWTERIPLNVDKGTSPYKIQVFSKVAYMLTYKAVYKLNVDNTGLNGSEIEIPEKFALFQNYPNPFNPTTKISYSLPASRHVEISLYNMQGKEIYKLVDAQKNAGNYEIHFDGSKLSSGVYFYKLTAGDYTDTKKMILMK